MIKDKDKDMDFLEIEKFMQGLTFFYCMWLILWGSGFWSIYEYFVLDRPIVVCLLLLSLFTFYSVNLPFFTLP